MKIAPMLEGCNEDCVLLSCDSAEGVNDLFWLQAGKSWIRLVLAQVGLLEKKFIDWEK